MGWVSKIIGEATATGVSETLNGVGDAAIKLGEAITGDLPPEKVWTLMEIGVSGHMLGRTAEKIKRAD